MRNNVDSPWTEAVTADLIRLWSHGYSCSQIGKIIGVTRNAVIGKAHRLELPAHSRSNNINGQKRAVDPKPMAEPREPSDRRARSRPRVCPTLFKSRERKPGNKIFNTPPVPGLIAKVSALTGAMISVPGFKRQRGPEMTKDEMRAMLTTAVQNTAAMEMAE